MRFYLGDTVSYNNEGQYRITSVYSEGAAADDRFVLANIDDPTHTVNIPISSNAIDLLYRGDPIVALLDKTALHNELTCDVLMKFYSDIKYLYNYS